MANQDYTVGQLMQIEACTDCRLCADVCPAVSASQDGELSALFRMKGLKQILKGRTGLFRFLFRKSVRKHIPACQPFVEVLSP